MQTSTLVYLCPKERIIINGSIYSITSKGLHDLSLEQQRKISQDCNICFINNRDHYDVYLECCNNFICFYCYQSLIKASMGCCPYCRTIHNSTIALFTRSISNLTTKEFWLLNLLNFFSNVFYDVTVICKSQSNSHYSVIKILDNYKKPYCIDDDIHHLTITFVNRYQSTPHAIYNTFANDTVLTMAVLFDDVTMSECVGKLCVNPVYVFVFGEIDGDDCNTMKKGCKRPIMIYQIDELKKLIR